MNHCALVLAGLLALWPSPAVASPAPTVPTRIQHVVSAWKTMPVFVDPLDAEELSPAEAATLGQSLAHADPPLFVAVMPASSNDESEGNSEKLLYTLYRANGRQGIYVLVNESGSIDDEGYGFLPGDGPDDTDDNSPVSTRLAQLTHNLLKGAVRDSEPVRAPNSWDDPGSPTGTVVGSAVGGVALGISAYWLVVCLVGLLRMATGRPFRWSRAATSPTPSLPTARRHG